MRLRIISGLVVALALSACGGTGSSSAGDPSPSASSVSAAPSAAVTSTPDQSAKRPKPVDPRKDGFDVGFGEFAITMEAKAIRPGPVTFVIHNGGTLVHGFEMKSESEDDHSGHGGGGEDRFKIEAATFRPDRTIEIKAKLPVGVYEIECYVANHDDLGMRATLVVKEDAPLVRPQQTDADEVLIEGFSFAPGDIEVAAGSTVTWTNQDPTEHTVTAHDGSFTSEPLPSGKGYRFTFDQAGTFEYYCAIHPTMTGAVKVTS